MTHDKQCLKVWIFPQADLDYIAAEIEDLERVMAELEEFAQATPWVSQQVQPAGNKI